MENPGITESSRHMSVGDWMLAIFLTAIPIVNIIMLFIWALGDSTNLNKKNWAKATLIWFGIIIALYVLFFVFIFSTSSMMG